ncbi:clan AA aspartic protease [Candidatus Poriferisodalis sp.]|uniref:clan AA aspartic protease n=1 Tax=Candidatus Poriferisodalis sp. TaxID=3101277 RepID=UPI003D105019
MIEGTVNTGLEAIITLAVSGTAERSSRVDALIDTGYGGDITLPSDVVNDLGLMRVGSTKLMLANGNEEVFDTFVASVDWSGSERGVAVHETESVPLIGMQMLEGQRLQVDVERDGRVLIETLRG